MGRKEAKAESEHSHQQMHKRKQEETGKQEQHVQEGGNSNGIGMDQMGVAVWVSMVVKQTVVRRVPFQHFVGISDDGLNLKLKQESYVRVGVNRPIVVYDWRDVGMIHHDVYSMVQMKCTACVIGHGNMNFSPNLVPLDELVWIDSKMKRIGTMEERDGGLSRCRNPVVCACKRMDRSFCCPAICNQHIVWLYGLFCSCCCSCSREENWNL